MTRDTTPQPWLEILRPNPRARLRLLCLPYAGGGTHFYRAWPLHLQPWVDILAAQLPGRERRLREKPVAVLQTMVDEIARALTTQRDVPSVFFGHSMGARLAFEIARKLRRENGPSPVHLIVSGHRAPQLSNPDAPIHHLPDAEFLQKVRRYNGIPSEALQNGELMKLILPALRADFTASEKAGYDSELPLPCSITAYGGLQDPHVDRPSLDAWREQTKSNFVLRLFPGDHFFMESNQQLFFQQLSQELREIMAREAGSRGAEF